MKKEILSLLRLILRSQTVEELDCTIQNSIYDILKMRLSNEEFIKINNLLYTIYNFMFEILK